MIFKKAVNNQAFLKMGLMGFAGSGKTFTATQVAIGLAQFLEKKKLPKKPIFFLDTASGSDWVQPKVEKEGFELFVSKTRAFSDLIQAVPEAEKSASILIIDSITHFWAELCEAYRKKKNRSYLTIQDWMTLKNEWALSFTQIFLNSALHIIICGRAGFEFDTYEDEAGRKQMEKTGIKMKAESEMGYEPSLLVLMERETDLKTNQVNRIAYILKDRCDLIDGKAFKNPTIKDFSPHINFLNIGGEHISIDMSRNSEDMISNDGIVDHRQSQLRRTVVLEEIQELFLQYIPGQTIEEKKKKGTLIRKHFNGVWSELEGFFSLEKLKSGFDSLHQELVGKPSRYTKAEPAAPVVPEEIKKDDPLGEKEFLLSSLTDWEILVSEKKIAFSLDKFDLNTMAGIQSAIDYLKALYPAGE